MKWFFGTYGFLSISFSWAWTALEWLSSLPSAIAHAVLAALDAIGAFTADFFWALATSPLVLILFAALAVAAFAVAHLPWVGKLFPSTIPFMRTAGIVSVVAFAALFFFLGARVADQRFELAKAENDLAWSEFQLDQQRQVANAADQLKREADARAAEAEAKLGEYQQRFGENPSDPPPGVLDWLRAQQRRPRLRLPATKGGADQTKRSSLARMRASGGQRQ